MAQNDPMLELRNDIVKVAGGMPDSAFTVIPDFAEIPGNVYFKSVRWAEEVFREGLGPFDSAEGTVHSFHVSGGETLDFDLVRHTYRAAGCSVDIREGAGFYYMSFTGYDGQAFGGADPAKQAERIAATFLKVSPSPFAHLDAGAGDSSPAYSTSADKTLTQVKNWTDRLDAIRIPNGIGIICYKRHIDLEEIIDFNKWFPADFRREHSGSAKN